VDRICWQQCDLREITFNRFQIRKENKHLHTIPIKYPQPGVHDAHGHLVLQSKTITMCHILGFGLLLIYAGGIYVYDCFITGGGISIVPEDEIPDTAISDTLSQKDAEDAVASAIAQEGGRRDAMKVRKSLYN
jgi:hypothetical protein